MTVSQRRRFHSTRRLAAVTVAWLAAGGLLTSVALSTSRLETAARLAATFPRRDGAEDAFFETCYLCLDRAPPCDRRGSASISRGPTLASGERGSSALDRRRG